MVACNHMVGYEINKYDGANDGEAYIYTESALSFHLAKNIFDEYSDDDVSYHRYNYCPICGQKIPWDDIIRIRRMESNSQQL